MIKLVKMWTFYHGNKQWLSSHVNIVDVASQSLLSRQKFPKLKLILIIPLIGFIKDDELEFIRYIFGSTQWKSIFIVSLFY